MLNDELKKYRCDFCNSLLSSISSLNYHKKTNKKCILLRDNNTEIKKHEYTCSNCGFITQLKKTIKSHKCRPESIEIYKIYLSLFDIENIHKEEIKSIKNLHKEELQNLKQQLDKSEENNERLLSDNINLERKLEIHEEKLYTLAARPTISTINNNTRVDNLLISVDFKESTIKDRVESNFTLEHLNDGLRGVAKFTKDYIVKSEDGKQKYICSDPSRAIFKYKDENGVVQKDVKASKLKNAIKDPIISKSKTLFIEENSRLFEDMANSEDNEIESINCMNDKITVLKDNFLKVKNIDENSHDYAKEMVLVINE
jgi:hypothetical protein